LTVFDPRGRPFFLEFKTPAGRLSEPQEKFRAWAMAAGIPYEVCRSLDEAKQVLRDWGCVREEAPMAE
jgi:hypothetical protein